ncbi:AraC family transcriptional regulator [Novosphingobium sp. JCM 18896]|uniref:AraC family transcriptional regulator n=1 Tax=Novosphingobium sp. JCM 18896 TaxID=2989731 RepID=UPI00222147BF|nr:helix-turn-helix transcriptional regulator [Novosphingobium sp. JCM 18896]MCW1429865.1 helix-turn-helix transcriptional regulator [Novosphingobium sp. JCM 18896]
MARYDIDPDLECGLVTLADPASRGFAGGLIQDEFDIDSPWHHHDMHQLQYAFEGSMELEDGEGRHLLPRSLAGWIPAGTRHRNSLHRISSVSVLLAPDCVPEPGEGVRILRVSPLMREMIAEAARWPLGAALDATGQAFFAAFARLCGEWIADRAPLTLPTTPDPVLGIALAAVRADPAGCRMDDAARAAGLSERSLRRRCQAQLGMGWDEYRRRARLLVSIEALTESERSIAQVAADVGFESQSAFARAFRRLTGEAPQAFRAAARRRG